MTVPPTEEPEMIDAFCIAACDLCGYRAYLPVADVEAGLHCSECDVPLVALTDVSLDEIAPPTRVFPPAWVRDAELAEAFASSHPDLHD
jgi:hypothetical protein